MSVQDWETVTFSKNYSRLGGGGGSSSSSNSSSNSSSSSSSSNSSSSSSSDSTSEPQRNLRFIPPGYNSQSNANGTRIIYIVHGVPFSYFL